MHEEMKVGTFFPRKQRDLKSPLSQAAGSSRGQLPASAEESKLSRNFKLLSLVPQTSSHEDSAKGPETHSPFPCCSPPGLSPSPGRCGPRTPLPGFCLTPSRTGSVLLALKAPSVLRTQFCWARGFLLLERPPPKDCSAWTPACPRYS